MVKDKVTYEPPRKKDPLSRYEAASKFVDGLRAYLDGGNLIPVKKRVADLHRPTNILIIDGHLIFPEESSNVIDGNSRAKQEVLFGLYSIAKVRGYDGRKVIISPESKKVLESDSTSITKIQDICNELRKNMSEPYKSLELIHRNGKLEVVRQE